MPKVARSLTAQRLISEYLKETGAGTLVAADGFDRIAVLAAQCVNELEGPRKVVAYTLFMFFSSAAYNFSDRAVSSSEASAFQSAFHQPVLEAIEFIQNISPDPAQLETICLQVIMAHQSAMPI